MALEAPVLDDRKFQQIVDEAKKRIPRYCPEWTDHNVSDPGVTLIELFAWMMEMLLYRMNQVPELHYIKFLEMLGVQRQSPVAATVDITVWLSEPLQETSKLIEARTEVATTQTEKKPSVVFTTEDDYEINPPILKQLLAQDHSERTLREFFIENKQIKDSQGKLVTQDNGITVFTSEPPQRDDALYFGFANDISFHILRLTLTVVELQAAGGGRDNPPYEWQGYTGSEQNDGWEACLNDGEIKEADRTENMNHSNYVQFHVPKLQRYSIAGHPYYWLRVRLVDPRYRISPLLYGVTAAAMGRTLPAVYARKAENELIGQSEGLPGQIFVLQNKPILARRSVNENLYIMFNNQVEEWEEKPDFADSDSTSRHYTLDRVTGELRLGPAVRQPDGVIRQYGHIPPLGAQLVFRCYHYLNEQNPILAKDEINTLKTSISYIKRVRNLTAPKGGRDVETLDDLKMRVTRSLRTSGRAVTAQDFEYLVAEQFNHEVAARRVIARANCILPANGQDNQHPPNLVKLLVIPYIEPEANGIGRLTAIQLERALEEQRIPLEIFLKERCLLTTRIQITAPEYRWVSVNINLSARNLAEGQRNEVGQRLLAKLYRYLNPINGGPTGNGWPYGAAVQLEDIYKCLRAGQNPEDSRFIREVTLFQAKPDGAPEGVDQGDSIKIDERCVVASGQHFARFD